jgi:hypothetical protein
MNTSLKDMKAYAMLKRLRSVYFYYVVEDFDILSFTETWSVSVM